LSELEVGTPDELRRQGVESLELLAYDLRQRILSACLRNGGHLGASLGTVELAIALHYTFRSPDEPIVWDVGHQAYAHKLLTGRSGRFDTLRTTGGISGFLSREESEHDVFGAGHSSTSLSAALAMAWARSQDPAESARWTVAVIGDGGMTAGVALEALNNVRALPLGPLLVVLNDNQMSISANVGSLPVILAGGQAQEFFQLLGFDYAGPIDGHDLRTLLGTLSEIRGRYAGRPVLLHVHTLKGKGYAPAEEQPAAYHGVSPVQSKAGGGQPSFSDTFGAALDARAERDPRVVAITAAMPEGTGLTGFAKKHPQRFFDVGIAEPHAVTFAAGLATQGYRPVAAIYSTFLQRAYDAIVHDVALQKLGVILAIDRAGVVGADGPTHHGAFDLAYLGAVPNISIACPSSLADVGTLLDQALAQPGPFAIRYPRGSGPATFVEPIEDGVRTHRAPETAELVVVALGASVARVLKAAEIADPSGQRVAVVSTVMVKPISRRLVRFLDDRPEVPWMTVEDGVIRGGFGQAVAAALGPRTGVGTHLGYADEFIPHGSVADLEKSQDLSVDRIAVRMKELLA
jgi:1-deoxy-D-xylulose-5-phosphate synthase